MQDFDELLHIAEQGDHRKIDMLVCDIYGGSHGAYGLPADLIASSFGKAARSPRDNIGNLYPSFMLSKLRALQTDRQTDANENTMPHKKSSDCKVKLMGEVSAMMGRIC